MMVERVHAIGLLSEGREHPIGLRWGEVVHIDDDHATTFLAGLAPGLPTMTQVRIDSARARPLLPNCDATRQIGRYAPGLRSSRCETQAVSVDCVFCRIVTRELPASVVHESAEVLAFMVLDPVTPGHMLVIPKQHLPWLADLGEDLAAEMFATTRALAEGRRRSSLRCEGVNLFYADGEAAFQEVFHSHLHVFPRFDGDAFEIRANWGSGPSRSQLDAVATEIRAALWRCEGRSADLWRHQPPRRGDRGLA
ncbi:MAG TPA: HIT family protein [Microthrixaceae bacterium]|nr:HIT family protein [Microthrixaceae bacterium]